MASVGKIRTFCYSNTIYKLYLISMNKLFLVAAVVVVLGGGYYFYNNSKPSTNPQVPKEQTSTEQTSASPSAVMEKNVVTLTANGYEPQTLTVKAGTKVSWVNKSGETATVNSDNHPTHELYPFLNLGKFEDGGSLSVVVEKPGTYTYHNHLNPDQKGTLIAQ